MDYLKTNTSNSIKQNVIADFKILGDAALELCKQGKVPPIALEKAVMEKVYIAISVSSPLFIRDMSRTQLYNTLTRIWSNMGITLNKSVSYKPHQSLQKPATPTPKLVELHQAFKSKTTKDKSITMNYVQKFIGGGSGGNPFNLF